MPAMKFHPNAKGGRSNRHGRPIASCSFTQLDQIRPIAAQAQLRRARRQFAGAEGTALAPERLALVAGLALERLLAETVARLLFAARPVVAVAVVSRFPRRAIVAARLGLRVGLAKMVGR